jgi:hypothetical protein
VSDYDLNLWRLPVPADVPPAADPDRRAGEWGLSDPKKMSPVLKEDHQKIQGTWDRPPAKDKDGLIIQGIRLTFKDNRLKTTLYVKETDLNAFEEGSFELREVGGKRVIYQSGDGELEPSSTPYRLEGDRLILSAEKGAFKGEWRRLKEKQ